MLLPKGTKVKRVAVYVFHDGEGIVDDYVVVFLKGLLKHIDRLVVVINGEVNDEGRKKIISLTNDIIIRENIGYDITGYKKGIEYLGWDEIYKYDELILVNSTLYGPFYPFSEMFETMEKRDVDFWGITKHHMVEYDVFGTCKYGYIPEHIQSSFLVIRGDMLKGKDFRDVWTNLPKIHSYAEAIGFFEVIFTKEFKEKGYKADTYINTDDLEGYTRYPLMMMSYELVKNRRCPVMKQKSFSQNYYDILTDTVGNTTIDTFEYIRDNCDYDVNLIWDNILRLYNMADIKNLMHFNYVLSQDYSYKPGVAKGKRVALMMHLYYPDLVKKCINYAQNMPENADVIITTSNDAALKIIEEEVKRLKVNKVIVLKIDNKGRDVSSLLVGCAPYVYDYDYVCFVHDKKTTQCKPFCSGESFSYKCFENCLGSKEFVENVILTFEQNPRMGMLMPPPPNHSLFYNIIGTEWASNYENTCSLAYKLGLHVNVDWRKEPISPLGTMFWFRPQALKTLFDYGWKYDDFPPEPNGFDGTLLHAVERVYGLVVQHERYYPAWLMTDKFARIEITNLYFMLREINTELLKRYFTNNLLDMKQKLINNLEFKWDNSLSKKLLIKKYMPKPMWRLCSRFYHSVIRNNR